jgi:Zn-dependent M28 family amino/carboxypeptidase
MKTLLYSIPLVFVLSCGTVKMKETDPVNISSASEKEIVSSSSDTNEIQFSSANQIETIMNYLASDELEGRDAGSEGIEKAADFIEGIFKENNIEPYFSVYKDTLSNFKETAYNIVGVIEGNDPELKNEFIIIGAHYDHIGRITSVNGDAIANGANDNASGTSTVLELARYFGNSKTNKRSIIFSLFSAEEKGLLGSKHLAEKLKAENLNLYVMLNFEMVGVPLVGKDYTMYLTGYENSNMASVANGYAGSNLIGFLPEAKKFNLFKRSDNYPFYAAFNVPSQTFCTFDFTNFDHYHGVDDEVELMDLSFMSDLVNKVIPVVEGISNAPIKEIKF